MEDLTKSLVFRDSAPSDWSFIFETWLKGFYTSPAAMGILPVRYFEGQRARINRLTRRPEFRVTLAAAPEDTAVIFSYVAYEARHNEFVIHWAYTKSNFRKMGIARTLLEYTNPRRLPYSHTHKPATHIRSTSHYNPYLLEDSYDYPQEGREVPAPKQGDRKDARETRDEGGGGEAGGGD